VNKSIRSIKVNITIPRVNSKIPEVVAK
jgi:hypothetical protein